MLCCGVRLGQETTTNTYEGHEFYFTLKSHSQGQGRGRPEVARFRMMASQVTYVIYNEQDDPSRLPPHLLEHNRREAEFQRSYRRATGLEYKHFFGPAGPRAPPRLFMFPAEFVGQVHRVTSPERHW